MSTPQVHEAPVATDEKSAIPPPAYSGPAPNTATTTAAAAGPATTSATGEIAPAQQPQQPTTNQNLGYESFNEPAKPEQARMQYAPQDDPSKHHPAPSGPARLVLPLSNLQDRPVEVDCPYCQRVTMTRVEEHSSGMTILAGVLVGFFCICLACLPCIMHTCADVDHFCSNCNRQLTHRPYEGTVAVVAQNGTAGGPPAGAVPSKYAQGNVQEQQQAPPPQQQQWVSSSEVRK